MNNINPNYKNEDILPTIIMVKNMANPVDEKFNTQLVTENGASNLVISIRRPSDELIDKLVHVENDHQKYADIGLSIHEQELSGLRPTSAEEVKDYFARLRKKAGIDENTPITAEHIRNHIEKGEERYLNSYEGFISAASAYFGGGEKNKESISRNEKGEVVIKEPFLEKFSQLMEYKDRHEYCQSKGLAQYFSGKLDSHAFERNGMDLETVIAERTAKGAEVKRIDLGFNNDNSPQLHDFFAPLFTDEAMAKSHIEHAQATAMSETIFGKKDDTSWVKRTEGPEKSAYRLEQELKAEHVEFEKFLKDTIGMTPNQLIKSESGHSIPFSRLVSDTDHFKRQVEFITNGFDKKYEELQLPRGTLQAFATRIVRLENAFDLMTEQRDREKIERTTDPHTKFETQMALRAKLDEFTNFIEHEMHVSEGEIARYATDRESTGKLYKSSNMKSIIDQKSKFNERHGKVLEGIGIFETEHICTSTEAETARKLLAEAKELHEKHIQNRRVGGRSRGGDKQGENE